MLKNQIDVELRRLPLDAPDPENIDATISQMDATEKDLIVLPRKNFLRVTFDEFAFDPAIDCRPAFLDRMLVAGPWRHVATVLRDHGYRNLRRAKYAPNGA